MSFDGKLAKCQLLPGTLRHTPAHVFSAECLCACSETSGTMDEGNPPLERPSSRMSGGDARLKRDSKNLRRLSQRVSEVIGFRNPQELCADMQLIHPGQLERVKRLAKDDFVMVDLCRLHDGVATEGGKWMDAAGSKPVRVAVKRLRASALTEQDITCFAREAEVLLRLDHR